MTMHAPAVSSGLEVRAVAAAGVLESRTGTIHLPRGLPGFASMRSFRLEPPAASGAPFIHLRSTDQPMLSFVVLPVPVELQLLAAADRDTVCDELGIESEDLLLLLMLTLEPGPAGLAAFANLRAPLFVDTERRLGWQVVLPARHYPIRYPLRTPR